MEPWKQRERGTPQGSAISRLLANLFPHYTFGPQWPGSSRAFPSSSIVMTSRCIVSASSKPAMWAADRGTTGRGRSPVASGENEGGVLPTGRPQRQLPEHRSRSWHTPSRTHGPARGWGDLQRLPSGRQQRYDEQDESRRERLAVASVDRAVTGRSRGMGQQACARWLNYYGRYYRTALLSLIHRINADILRWARKKYKRLDAFRRAVAGGAGVTEGAPGLFKHWAGRTDSNDRMRRAA